MPLSARAAEVSPVMATLSDYMAAREDRALPRPDRRARPSTTCSTPFAAMISGSELPPGRAALALARAEAGDPVATVAASSILTGPWKRRSSMACWPIPTRPTIRTARSQSHPGASVVPAALAVGESRAASAAATSCAPLRSATTSARE